MEEGMAVYRSDQAQLTFGVEPAPGGYAELATAVTLATSGDAGECAINLGSGQPAGSRSLTVDGMAAGEFVAGDIIVIGTTANQSSEIRRVEYVDGTTGLVLDAPTAFFHANDTAIKIITAVTAADNDVLMRFIPGVYESVEVPDPEQSIEPRYFLGTASKRNFYTAYKGQQTYAGSLGGFVLLDGRPLRFPIGKVTTTTTFVNTAGSGDPSYGALINKVGGVKKGDVFVPIDTSWAAMAPGHYVLFTGSTVAGTTTSATSEIRKQVGSSSSTLLRLDAPLQFDHANDEFVYVITTTAGGSTALQGDSLLTNCSFTHSIAETIELDSVSWHVHMRDTSEAQTNDFDRRYFGGKVGNMSLSAEEGGLLTCSWEGVNFLGMVHNQKQKSGYTKNQGLLPYYTVMQPVTNDHLDLPTQDPYYFSQGRVMLFGTEIARVRSFSLSINNNEEPRYYLTRQMGNRRGPTEIREQRREYSCAVTLALPDSVASATSTATTVFKELLLEGDYGSGMQGFDIELRFDRGANDSIVVTIPDSAAATGGNAQGAFIRTAPHNIADSNPLEVEADILFRNLKITIEDSTPVYI